MKLNTSKILLLLSLFMFLSKAISAQRTFSLRGNVQEAGTDKPLIGAAVSLDAKKTGILTDSSGNYYLRIPQDNYVVKVSFVGYKPYRKFIKLDKNTTLDVILEDVTKQLEEVIVSSVSTRTDIRTPSLGVSILSMKGIKKIPAMMGEVDVLRSLQTLPGVSSVGEGANGLNIRGGAVDENLIFIDDTPIFNPTHLLACFKFSLRMLFGSWNYIKVVFLPVMVEELPQFWILK